MNKENYPWSKGMKEELTLACGWAGPNVNREKASKVNLPQENQEAALFASEVPDKKP